MRFYLGLGAVKEQDVNNGNRVREAHGSAQGSYDISLVCEACSRPVSLPFEPVFSDSLRLPASVLVCLHGPPGLSVTGRLGELLGGS